MGDTNSSPTGDSDPERTVVVPGRSTPPTESDPDATGDYRVHEETTTVVPPRPPGDDPEKTQIAYQPGAVPAPQAAQWASSPMTPPPPQTPGPVPQGATQQWPQSPMTPPPGTATAGPYWPGGRAGAGFPPAPPAMGYPPFAPAAHAASGNRRKLLILAGAGLAVVVAVVLITGLWLPGYFNTDTLDVKAADTGVQQVLTDPTTGYGLPKVSDVACNKGQNPTITDGGTFTCTVTIAGNQRQVTVRFVGTDGTYAVGRPE